MQINFSKEIFKTGLSLKQIAYRMITDIILVNISFIASFVLWYFFKLYAGLFTQPEMQATAFIDFYVSSIWLFNLICALTFYLNGFYARTRTYRPLHRELVIFQGVAIAYISFTFLSYYIFRATLLPRGVLTLAALFSYITIDGIRLIKAYIRRRFRIERRSGSKSKNIERVLVVGGAGYIGSLLVRKLLDRGYRVRVMDVLLYGDHPIEELYNNPNFEFMKGDFRHVDSVVRSVRGIDAVIHLGAIVGDPASALDSDYTIEVNLAASRLLREVCKGYGIVKFIFASTCSVYGASNLKLDEKSTLNPVSLYARTKIDAETALLSVSDKDFSPTILRLSTVFGLSYRARFDLVVNLLAAKAAKEKKISIFGGNLCWFTVNRTFQIQNKLLKSWGFAPDPRVFKA